MKGFGIFVLVVLLGVIGYFIYQGQMNNTADDAMMEDESMMMEDDTMMEGDAMMDASVDADVMVQ